MINLVKTGRIFYGLSIAELGLQTIYYQSFPYFLVPPVHACKTGMLVLSLVGGLIMILSGASFVLGKKARETSLLFGSLLLLIFCLYYVPYELLVSNKYKSPGEWENAVKELALAGGALTIAACFPQEDKGAFTRFLAKLIPAGAILYALPVAYFGILHFIFAKEASPLIPAWIPVHLFWMYFCGVALLGSGIAIILKIRVGLIALLLGVMIFTWFVILHLPRVVAAAPADMDGEIASAFLALAYSGTALVIAGLSEARKN